MLSLSYICNHIYHQQDLQCQTLQLDIYFYGFQPPHLQSLPIVQPKYIYNTPSLQKNLQCLDPTLNKLSPHLRKHPIPSNCHWQPICMCFANAFHSMCFKFNCIHKMICSNILSGNFKSIHLPGKIDYPFIILTIKNSFF